MDHIITVSPDNQLVIDQEKLKDLLSLEKHPIERQVHFLEQAINQNLVRQAGMFLSASMLDRDHYRDKWLQQKGSAATKNAYRKAIDDFFLYLDGIGVSSPILVSAEQVDDYLEELKMNYSDNSVRAKVSSCASFYSYLMRLKKVDTNPFHGVSLPRKQYKKAIQPDQSKPVPVMNIQELNCINDRILVRRNTPGTRSCNTKVRKGAKALFLAVHFMSLYGLRAGAIETIEIHGDYFSYLSKGGKTGRKTLRDDTRHILKVEKYGNQPLSGYRKISMQIALKKLTTELYHEGLIRSPYTCHDMRHFFAHEFYRGNHNDIVALRNALNHASINVTDVYLQNLGVQ